MCMCGKKCSDTIFQRMRVTHRNLEDIRLQFHVSFLFIWVFHVRMFVVTACGQPNLTRHSSFAIEDMQITISPTSCYKFTITAAPFISFALSHSLLFAASSFDASLDKSLSYIRSFDSTSWHCLSRFHPKNNPNPNTSILSTAR